MEKRNRNGCAECGRFLSECEECKGRNLIPVSQEEKHTNGDGHNCYYMTYNQGHDLFCAACDRQLSPSFKRFYEAQRALKFPPIERGKVYGPEQR